MSGEQKLPSLLSEGSGEPVVEKPVLGGGFSLDDWVSGRDQATRVVRIYGSLSLYGDREALGEQLQVAKAVGDKDEVKRLRAEIDDLTVRMQEDVLDFRLQALTQSRKQEVVAASKEYDPDDGVGAVSFLLSEFIVEPPGVTPEQVAVLAEWDDVQVGKLAQAMNQLITSVPNVEARPF